MKKFLEVKVNKAIEIMTGPYSGSKVMMFSDKDGNDWYEMRKNWSGVAMVQPDTRIICALERDVERLSVAVGMDLYEISHDEIPQDFSLGSYMFIDGKFVAVQ